MRLMVLICAVFVLTLSFGHTGQCGQRRGAKSSNNYTELPLKLAWGDSRESIEEKGLKLVEQPAMHNETRSFYLLERPSGKLPLICAILAIDDKDGLVSVRWTGENIGNDPFGKAGLAAYEKISKTMTVKYGKPVVDIDWMEARYIGTAQFYGCLNQYSNHCGQINRAWVAPDMSILMMLLGTGTTGQIYIHYRHKSVFSEADKYYYRQRFRED